MMMVNEKTIIGIEPTTKNIFSRLLDSGINNKKLKKLIRGFI